MYTCQGEATQSVSERITGMMPLMKRLRHCFPLLLPILMFSPAVPAAGPDMALFGIVLGARFDLPPCAAGEDALTRRHCHNPAHAEKLPWGGETRRVFYPRPQVVPWARGEITVEVADGIIEAIHVQTWGIQSQDSALEALQKQFGPPTRLRSEKLKAQRARLPGKFALWELKDATVTLDGVTTTIDWGRITLATHRHRKLSAHHPSSR